MLVLKLLVAIDFLLDSLDLRLVQAQVWMHQFNLLYSKRFPRIDV